jgi:8-oxo-dGTP pyrophosphatase MutT (NUDIX family)
MTGHGSASETGCRTSLHPMPVPDFVVELRKQVGQAELWMPGVTEEDIRRDDEALLVRRSDNGAWAPVTGIVDPGEEPAVCAAREAREEAGVEIRVDRLASTTVMRDVVHANGDRAAYLDPAFVCTWFPTSGGPPLSGRSPFALPVTLSAPRCPP